MSIIRTSVLLVLITLFSGRNTEETLEQYIDRQVHRTMKKHHLPGIIITVVEDQNILYEGTIGYADLEHEQKVSSLSVFKLLSVSKLFTAMEIFREVEEGLVKLDDPLTKYLPNFKIRSEYGEQDQISIRNILAHESGLPRNECLKVQVFEGETGSLDRFEIGTWDCIQATPSGTRYKYSNLGYNLLGRVIEENRKTGYARFMREEFLNSLGMSNTTFDSGDIIDKESLVLGYHYHKRKYHPMVQHDIKSVPSGNMYSTLNDLTTFLQSVLRGDVFQNESTMSRMFQCHYNTSRNPETMGLGWKTTRFRDAELLVWHDGGPSKGIGALIVLLPHKHIDIAMAANSTSFGRVQSVQLASKILHRIVGESERIASDESVQERAVIDPAVLERYEGNYVAWGSIMRVKSKKGKLKGRIEGFGLSLIPLNENEFRVIHISFHTNESREPSVMIIDMDYFSYEICPLYPAELKLPENMQDIEGDYEMAWRLPDNKPGPLSGSRFNIGFEDQVLSMSGIFGPLLPLDQHHLTILSGPFAGEIIEYDKQSGRLLHQNGIFMPADQNCSLSVKFLWALLATFLYLSYSIDQCLFTLEDRETHMVESLRAGKEKAYAKLFKEYYRPLTVFANRYLNDLDASKELVQDLFVSIYENRKTQLITTSIKSYLYQSVKNRCLNQLKKAEVRRSYQKQAMQSGASNNSLEEQIHANELEHQIFRIISQLSPKCREVFIMSRVKGIKNQEIAEKLEISIRTVETHISNVLKALRQQLGDEYNF